MRWLPVATVAACAACGGAGAAAVIPDETASLAACIPSRSVGSGPIGDPGGPYYHQVVLGYTRDGLSLDSARQVLDHASVPDGVRRADGTVLVYYVNGDGGAVWVARIENGRAVVLSPIAINGVSAPAGMVDPDATLLAGGTIRLAYFGGLGPPNATTPRAMCIADADDGVHFTVRSAALTYTTPELLTDPSLLQLADGSWLMAISAGQRTLITRSSDGLHFTREATFAFGGVPELARAADGTTRLYVCAGGIVAYRSTDGGRTWTREATVVGPGFNGHQIVCDPSLVAGAGMFVFKTGQ